MKKIIGFAMLIFSLGFFACNNDEDLTLQSEELSEKSAQVALNEVKMEAATAEAEYEVEFFSNMAPLLSQWWNLGKYFGWTNRLRYGENQCPNVEIHQNDTTAYPKVITMDYGDSTVLHNGTVLSGIIQITISAPRYSQEYERTVEYLNFVVDSTTIDGYATITVDKVDTMFRQFVSDFTFTLADGTVIDKTSERVWQWLEGMDTWQDQSDDVFVISGKEESVMTADGETTSYKKEITTPLKRLGDCKYIVEGVVEITVNGAFVSSIDYGDGTCDETAIVTDADGNETEIDLQQKQYKGEMNQNKNQSGKQGK